MVDRIIGNNRKRKVKRLSGSTSSSNLGVNLNSYYPSAFINKPCDQLFGPQPLDCSLNKSLEIRNIVKNCLECSSSITNNNSINDDSASLTNKSGYSVPAESGEYSPLSLNTSINLNIENSSISVSKSVVITDSEYGINSITTEKFTYIPAPKWNKIQNSVLEELFRKSRYPKPSELKQFAQRLNVMDSDIEEWFRKRRGKDRKTRRKNETLKSLIDNYLDK
jgi:hypothetical protein